MTEKEVRQLLAMTQTVYPNYNANCDNTLEWAVDIEKQVEEEIIKISLNL